MPRNDNIDDIVATYSPPLLRFITEQVKCREDAEDILQDVFYQLARVNDDPEYRIDTLSSWLYRVARNMILNFRRKNREISLSAFFEAEDEICEDFAQTLASPAEDGPEAVFFRNLVWRELDAALSELPPEQCEVFCLTVFDRLLLKPYPLLRECLWPPFFQENIML